MQAQGVVAVASLAVVLFLIGTADARRILQQAYSGAVPTSYGYYGSAATYGGSYGLPLPMGYQALPPAADESLPGRRKTLEQPMPYTAIPSTLGYSAYAMPTSYAPAYGASAASRGAGAYPAAYGYGSMPGSSRPTYVSRSASSDGFPAGYYPSGSAMPAYAYGSSAAAAYRPAPYAPAYSAPSYAAMPETHSRKLFESTRPVFGTSSVILAYGSGLGAYSAAYSNAATAYTPYSASYSAMPYASGAYMPTSSMPGRKLAEMPMAYGSSSMGGAYGYGTTTGAAYSTSYGSAYAMPKGMAYGMSYSSAYGGYGGYAK